MSHRSPRFLPQLHCFVRGLNRRFAPKALLGLAGLLVSPQSLAAGIERDPMGFNLLGPVTPIADAVHTMNNYLLIMCFGISLFVLSLILYILWRYRAGRRNPVISQRTHNGPLEVIWTLVPTVIIVALAIPSFKLIHIEDNPPPAELTVIVRGYQWYWSYEYPDLEVEEFTSIMIPDEDIGPGQVRLLSVDAPLVIPSETNVEFLITSGDVLHSFAVPNFAVRRDALPGRMTSDWAFVPAEKEGTYYGQCSELCGIGHGFMPIEVRVVSKDQFESWVAESLALGGPAAPPPRAALARATP
ncbi:MAG: cytochrome c oxidase subunit II [Pseudomonadota bacterium]